MTHKKLIIIGSGPSGYTAAIYTGRANIETMVFTGPENGGQLMYTTDVENFPGFPEGVVGPKLMSNLREQATKLGAVVSNEIITAVDFSAKPFKFWTKLPSNISFDQFNSAAGEDFQKITKQIKKLPHEFTADSVIISTGAVSIMSGVPGEKELKGRGVSTCAVCDAAFFRNRKVFVIGGGDSAMEDATALAKFTSEVTIIHRRDSFKASKIMQDRVLKNPNIKVLWNSSIKEVIGKDFVSEVKVDVAGEMKTFPADGVFLAIGHTPSTKIFTDQVKLDGHGYVLTGLSMTKTGLEMAKAALSKDGLVQFPSMTSVAGVFAAGDVVDVRYKQAITAAGQGCAAALDAERWLESVG